MVAKIVHSFGCKVDGFLLRVHQHQEQWKPAWHVKYGRHCVFRCNINCCDRGSGIIINSASGIVCRLLQSVSLWLAGSSSLLAAGAVRLFLDEFNVKMQANKLQLSW
ncbi:unnamed protein product [Urochloa humidicola]